MRHSQWLSIVILAMGVYVLWRIRQVLLLALTAVIFATVLNQGVQYLHRYLRSRKVSVLVMVGAVLLILTVFGLVIVPPFVTQLRQVLQQLPVALDVVGYWSNRLDWLLPEPLRQNLRGIDSAIQQIQALDWEMLARRFLRLFSNTLTVTLNVLLVTVLTIMFVSNPAAYAAVFTRAFPASVRPQVRNVLERCKSLLAGWFLGILFNMSVIALLSGLGLWLLGVPLAFANGLLAGLLAFIPNIGPVLSVLPPAAIALLDAPWKALAVIILYVVIQQLESNILTPLVMQKQVSLLPAVTLLSQVLFAVFFGFWGLLIALPLTLILQIWLEEFWVRPVLDRH